GREAVNADTLAKHYGRLTAQERFSLILAAGDRGDEAEQDRLVRAGGRITLSFPDHAPYARAFDDLAMLTFIELLDAAADCLDAWHLADGAEPFGGDEGEPEGDEAGADDEGEMSRAEEGEAGGTRAEVGARPKPTWQRFLDLALARGYVLKAK